MTISAFVLFHLNLGFSSLDKRDRLVVVRQCYEPMLEMVEESSRPVAIEASGWTLTQISEIAPHLIDKFKELVDAGKIELVGSGWAQIIGPLVPSIINVENQKLGLAAYNQILGTQPKVALVNEMAFSAGLVDIYSDAGYSGLILDRENCRAALDLEHEAPHVVPNAVRGPLGSVLPIVWSDTILFQRFQRVIHDEISIDDYLATLKARVGDGQRVLPIYTNDAEVFGFRPGRFKTEAVLEGDEWQRIKNTLDLVDAAFAPEWVTPSQVLPDVANEPGVVITNVAYPVVVKKQRKYNLNRWALSGRDNLRINTAAHRSTIDVKKSGSRDPAVWRRTCEWWASDLRTHLTDLRWKEVRTRLDEQVPVEAPPALGSSGEATAQVRKESGIRNPVVLEGADVRVELDSRRGGVVKSLAFRSHGWSPSLGTVPQGTFSAIDVAVDFYTGGAVIDLAASGQRLTDLSPCVPELSIEEDFFRARIVSPENYGEAPLAVTTLDVPRVGEKVMLRTEIAPRRRRGTVRLGHLTLIPQAFGANLFVETMLGGAMERFALDRDVDHGAPISVLVSSTTSLGGASGHLRIGDGIRNIDVSWDPSECAAVPMLQHRRVGNKGLTRIVFSISEFDDTFRDGGALLPLSLCISP